MSDTEQVVFRGRDIEAIIDTAAHLGRTMGDGYPSVLDVMDTLAYYDSLPEITREPQKTIYTALLAFQADCPILIKEKKAEIVSKRTGGKFSYKFIPLPNIMETIQPLLTKHGLIWSTFPSCMDGKPVLGYKLSYAPTKESEQGVMPLILGSDPDSRAHGSALSYGRRQALEAVLNLVAQTDDDGATASGVSKQPQGDAKPVGMLGRRKVQEAISGAGKDEQGLLTAVGLEKIEDLTVGSAKAIRQILDGNKDA